MFTSSQQTAVSCYHPRSLRRCALWDALLDSAEFGLHFYCSRPSLGASSLSRLPRRQMNLLSPAGPSLDRLGKLLPWPMPDNTGYSYSAYFLSQWTIVWDQYYRQKLPYLYCCFDFDRTPDEHWANSTGYLRAMMLMKVRAPRSNLHTASAPQTTMRCPPSRMCRNSGAQRS